MLASASSEPDQGGSIIYVGQDRAGHWLVQDGAKSREGRFVSFEAAMGYARAERLLHHAELEIASHPLSSFLSFIPVETRERAVADIA